MGNDFKVENCLFKTAADLRKPYTDSEWQVMNRRRNFWKYWQLMSQTSMDLNDSKTQCYWANNHQNYGCTCCGEYTGLVRFSYQGEVTEVGEGWYGDHTEFWWSLICDLEKFIKNGETQEEGDIYYMGLISPHTNPDLVSFTVSVFEEGEEKIKEMAVDKVHFYQAILQGAESAYKFFKVSFVDYPQEMERISEIRAILKEKSL